MSQLELDLNIEKETDKTMLTFSDGNVVKLSILEDMYTWPELMIEFAKLLNKAEFIIPIDIVEKHVYNSMREHKLRLTEEEVTNEE